MFEIAENDGTQDELLSLISAASVIDLGVQTYMAGTTSGLECTYSSGMTIDISSGYYSLLRQTYAYAGGSVVISAGDVSDDRIDIIEIDDAGTVTVTEGTPADPPREPARSTASGYPDQAKLAMVLVKANDSSSLSAIGTPVADRRTFAQFQPFMLNGTVDPTGVDGVDGDFYMNTTTNVLFGPKDAGSWPTGIALAGPIVTVQSNWTIGDGVPAGTPSAARVLRRKW